MRKRLWSLVCLVPLAAGAQYHYFNVGSGSDCILQDYRSPNVPPGIYDAIHEEYVSSSDSGSGYFYGGFTHQNNVNGSPMALLQYVCWPASGGYPFSYSQQIPTFAGTNMVGYAQIGEGSSCAIKGFWPEFTTNLWTREAVRYWQPTDGTAHVGYQGMWMKEPVSGNWYHVGTFTYPFAVTGVNGMSGWQENFSGYTGDYLVDHANGYYHQSGAWQRANQIQYTSHGYVYLINNGTGTESAVGPDFTSLYNVPTTLTVGKQPAQPTFDPIVVTSPTASLVSTQLLVQWQVPLSSSPPLGYLIEVFPNAGLTGAAALSYFNYDPEARQALLTLTNVATPYVRLTISDIFFNTNAAILITPATANPSPAVNVSGTVGGLAYQYYQSSSGDWTSLPNFGALTPVRQGAVSFPDVSPRQQRSNYAFNYTGYLTVPATGLYAFTLHSGDGSQLIIDGATVISFDGLHDSSQFLSGGIALAAGAHTFNLQFFKGAANPVNSTAYTDGLGLAWQGPGIAPADVPASVFSRVPGTGEPAITLSAPTNNATLLNASPGLSAAVTPNGVTVNSVQFLLTDYYSYYARPSRGVDYVIGQDTTAPFTFNSMVWTAATNLVRARLIYNGTSTLDSVPVAIATTNGPFAPWSWTPLELHNYPSGAALQAGTFTMVGDGMNMLSRQVTGDCTLVARLASITPSVAGPDGVAPDGSWRAGIIFRGTTNTTIGQPLGDGSSTRFAALFSSVGGGTYYENDYMRGGNGDANAWSGNLGGGNHWYQIQRVGDQFTSSVSMDGVNWTQVSTTNLTGIGATIFAGVFIHALQSMNPNVHIASLDSYSLTGAGVVGPASVTISPSTNAVIGGLPATFAASVVGPVPAGYQWQLNGTNVANATNATYTIGSAALANAGSYTVVANNVTSPPALLVISAPAGSGVWTNGNGGSWNTAANWTNALVAGGTDAAADFSTLSLSTSLTIALDGARTVGSLLFDDRNVTTKHNWMVSTGSGGPLTLAVSSGTPNVSIQSATNTISAVVAGTQGFTKVGPGYLTLSGASTVTGTISVNNGTLEVQNKNGDTPYAVAPGATLKLGYSTGGGYANTALTISGSGVAATTGFYLAGGKTYNASGEIVLQAAPTTLRRYGTGYANIGTFDINGTGLWCTAAASGSALDPNLEIVSAGYGMSMQIDAGANTSTGDLTINGPLNVGSLGLYKRGGGSLALNATALTGNTAVQVQGGTVICGVANCLGVNANVPVSSGATLALNGFNQTAASLAAAAGSTVSFGGTNTLTVTNATLAGVLQMTLNKGGTPASGRLVVTVNPLTFGGALVLTNISATPLAAGDTFTLFSASGYAGAFSSVSGLPAGLVWNTNNLPVNGTISIASNGLSLWNGGGTDANWSTAANWNGTAPTNGESLTFQGTVRLSNTNNLLSSVGQVTFTNGGFALAGNPVTLQWGLVNQAGNNTWGIASTFLGPESFVSSNGTLTVSGAVANGGYPLTVDGAGNSLVSGAISGTGGLMKNGVGILTLSSANTYTGGTIANNGTLKLSYNSGGSGTLYDGLTINAGATGLVTVANALGYSGSAWVRNLTLNGGTLSTAIAGNDNGFGLTINMTGGTLGSTVLNGYFAMGLDSSGNGSTINVYSNPTPSVISANLTVRDNSPGGILFNVRRGTNATDLNVTGSLLSQDSGGITLAGGGVMQLAGVNTYTGPTTISAGTLMLGGAGKVGNGAYAGSIVNNGALVFNTSAGNTLSGVISGTGSLTNSGSGTLFLTTAANTFSGGTVITGGTLSLGNGTANSENANGLGSGPVTVRTGGRLLCYLSSSTTTCNIPNAVTLDGGTLWGQYGYQHFAGPVTVTTNGGTLSQYYDTRSVWIDGLLAGSGPLTINNPGSGSPYTGVHFSNPSNTYSGTITVSGNAATVDNTYALSNATINVTGGGSAGPLQWGSGVTSLVLGGLSGTANIANSSNALSVGSNGSTNTYSGVLSGAGSLTKIGAGLFTLAGTNTYTGLTTVNAGALLINGALGTNTVTVATNALLGGNGVIGGATTVQTGGALSPGVNGIGKLTFSTNLTLAGIVMMEISRNGGVPTNDAVLVSATLTQGGSLVVTNIGTNALVVGDSFPLFNASAYAGSFSTLVLPTLASNLVWNTSTLATNGTISVASVLANPPPTIGGLSWSATNGFSLTATGAVGGAYVMLGASNLLPPVAWLPLLTNTADSNGIVSLNDPQATNLPLRFYRLKAE